MTLDEELKAAGFLTVEEALSEAHNRFHVHAGVKDLETFMQWLEMRTKEMSEMKARMILDKKDETELFEWVLSYCAAFNEVRVNLKAALANSQ